MPEPTYPDLLRQVIARQDLSLDQTHWAFSQIMDGLWSEAQIAGLLTALAAKGESVDELAGAARAMRERVVPIDTRGMDVIDTCGTGGTGLSTFNISTAAAMVLAGAGVKVAKHGNRTNTRASGSANVLEALGVNLDATPEVVSDCLVEAGVCFLFAIKLHPAMRHAAPIRRALGVRTIFNVLGPLTNPAGARRQCLGVFDGGLTETLAQVLGRLGAANAMVIHADDGLDEISPASATRISHWDGQEVRTFRVQPADFDLPPVRLEELFVTSAEESAQVVRGVLEGRGGAARNTVLLNAAAGLVVAGKAADLAAGVPMAAESIDSGRAQAALDRLVEVSRR